MLLCNKFHTFWSFFLFAQRVSSIVVFVQALLMLNCLPIKRRKKAKPKSWLAISNEWSWSKHCRSHKIPLQNHFKFYGMAQCSRYTHLCVRNWHYFNIYVLVCFAGSLLFNVNWISEGEMGNSTQINSNRFIKRLKNTRAARHFMICDANGFCIPLHSTSTGK